MNKIAVIFISLASLMLLSACSSRYASNAENQYLSSRNGNNLIVPPHLTSSNISHFYDLPQGSGMVKVNLAPPN